MLKKLQFSIEFVTTKIIYVERKSNVSIWLSIWNVPEIQYDFNEMTHAKDAHHKMAN